jgi:perosamine synthetase
MWGFRMDSIRNIPIALPCIGEEEWQAIRDPLFSGWLTQGPKVAAFEEGFAARHGVKHAVATTSCTTALHLILAAMEIGPGDEVIVPAFTWIATANVTLHCGATPVFVDIDRRSFNLDPKEVAAKVTSRTKAIIAVHLFGLCADMDAIAEAAPGIPIIEDAACAAGALYKGRSAGSLGMAAAFSFHPRKSITTGEGGMITTNDDTLAETARMLRNHGASISEEERHCGPKPYLMAEYNLLGFNYRMTDLQGAVGLVQLGKLGLFIEERQRWAEFYCQEFADISWLQTPIVPNGFGHGWQAFVCYVVESKSPLSRNEILERLQARGVSSRPGTHAVPMLRYYRERFSFKPEDFSTAWDCERYSLAIPLHNRMTEDDCRYVAEAIKGLN